MTSEIINKIEKISNYSSFIKVLNEANAEYQKSIDEIFRRSTGIYYTGYELADYLVKEMIKFSNFSDNILVEKKFLEPCVGIGIFVFSYLNILKNKGISNTQLKKAIKNIYVADIDTNALKIYSSLLKKFCQLNDIKLSKNYFETNIIDGLMIKKTGLLFEYIDIKKAFNIDFLFDFIITNPPYKNLKADKKQFENESDYQTIKAYYDEISLFARKKFKYSCEGVINLYKLFIEDILCTYASDNSNITLLIPSTILNDKSCNKLRDLIFKENTVNSINCINEQNKYIDANQALCSININKSQKGTSSFRFCQRFNDRPQYKTINYKKLSTLTNNNTILCLEDSDIDILNTISNYKVIKDYSFISNLRGELDLTFYKNYYSNYKTPYKLIRGRDIALFTLKETKPSDTLYVSEDFLKITQKKKFIEKPRIACQQIANLAKEKRLIFSFVDSNYILGNSCNFISVEDNIEGIDLFYLLGLLNSSFMNWFFKLKSSNNHINNYEIDEFPIPTNNKKLMQEISELTKSNLKDPSKDKELQMDKLVYQLFGISKNKAEMKKVKNMYENEFIIDNFNNDINSLLETQISIDDTQLLLNSSNKSERLKILQDRYPSTSFIETCMDKMIEKYQKIKSNQVLNHTTFKLSDLDLEMIRCVPQGGSWKNISPDVVKKSKRLIKITETGGRTTLYGRIDYNEPCYTITTYFNRPGNGTYVHPIYNRVISVREAARIQSFNDSYYFVGNKSDYLKQIGNAVPPLLAYELGKQILKNVDIKYSIDLFAGAGGLTSGIKKAGVKSLVGIDFEERACMTLKVNNPEINVICGDLKLQETKDKIYSAIKGKQVDLVCGGPPCQGFSMAGFRNPDDPRNKLFIEYVDVLKHILPKVFIMENVEGMRSMENGKVYETIKDEFRKLGYLVEGRLVMANDYGVPQKRKRLITIGVRKDLNINPSCLFPIPLGTIITAKDAIFDLEKIECNENSQYKADELISEYVKELQKL